MNIDVRPKLSASRLEKLIDKVTTVGLVAVVTLSTLLGVASPVAAAGTCGSSSNYHTGFYHDIATHPSYDFEGVSGYIVVRDAPLCSGNNTLGNFSNAWVMLAGVNPVGLAAWSQVGFERTAGQPLRWFSQHAWYNQGDLLSTRYSTFSIAAEVGKRHTFRVLWNYDCACLQATIDTTVWSNAAFNPFLISSGWGPRPFSPQFSGETGHMATDMPGTAAAHTSFTALGAQQYSDDALVPMPCTMLGVNANPSRWSRSASRCDAFDIWTSTP